MHHDVAMSSVVRVGQEQLESVATTVALSFADDPIWKWIYDSQDSLPLATGVGLARMLVAQSTPADEIHSIADESAVALWSAPDGSVTKEMEEHRDELVGPYAQVFAEQLGSRIELTGKLSAAMRTKRPEEPHWYLGILGTHPDRQSQGLGGQVLTVMLEKCDRLGLPTFLESSNPRNYGFYQRHGFTEVDELIVEDSPPLLGFWRPAR